MARLLGLSLLVMLCAVTATAWLASQSTTRAIAQEQGHGLAYDARIYDEVLGYAATNTSWAGVRPLLVRLAEVTGRQITLTGPDGVFLASSEPSMPALPARRSAFLDALYAEGYLTNSADAAGIDRRAVGLYRLIGEERTNVSARMTAAQACMTARGVETVLDSATDGRPTLVPRVGTSEAVSAELAECARRTGADVATVTERRALDELTALANACLAGGDRQRAITVRLGFTWTATEAPASPDDAPEGASAPEGAVASAGAPGEAPSPGAAVSPGADTSPENAASPEDAVSPGDPANPGDPASPGHAADPGDAEPDGFAPQPQECLDTARREQLRPYVAPPAYLYINDAASAATPVFDLAQASTLRIAGVSALVLAVAVAVTLLVGVRMSRPLHALTRAAEQGASHVPVRGRDEIARLTTAFNDLSARREAGERQRRTMVNDIAHELGTPLTTIRAWLQAARDGVADPGPELLDLLSDEAELLQHVIDDLRDLAAADAGRLRLHPELVYVDELLDQVVTAHRSRAEDVTIVLETAGDPEVVLDPLRVRQAVGNLLSNAVRHSPPGTTVTVRSRLETGTAGDGSDGRELVIEVADAGPGIDEDDLPHVFERFWRADRSRSRRTGGSGLGLAIVRDLAGAHGGTVTVTSRAGHGSTFTIRLPAGA
ncbi:sensor histidine kinase [Catenuloplanes japonicus]|uniref:sensor histidine kinase n=1 Tax=Catenuloplanes japonicus TaxID=33876 RepID=UPI000AD11CA2|nr:HAMP domain-containing sensor histidine kinase [Catenuloplanes japonicus]